MRVAPPRSRTASAKRAPAIGAVGVDEGGVVRNDRSTGAALMDVARRDIHALDHAGIGIGRDMRLVAVDRFSDAMPGPAGLAVPLARRGNHRRIDQCPHLHRYRPGATLAQ
jgi:hypothetical protein